MKRAVTCFIFCAVALMFVAFFLMGVVACFAQEAKVVELSLADAQEAKAKYEALKQAQKDWDNLQKRIENEYLVRHDSLKNNECVQWSDSGITYSTSCSGSDWASGFEFDSSFHFIVPKRSSGTLTINGSTPGCTYWNYQGSGEQWFPQYSTTPIIAWPQSITPSTTTIQPWSYTMQ
jgi:hypothetical protein